MWSFCHREKEGEKGVAAEPYNASCVRLVVLMEGMEKGGDRGRRGDIRIAGELFLQIMCAFAHPGDADSAHSLHTDTSTHTHVLLLSQNLCHRLMLRMSDASGGLELKMTEKHCR